MACAHSWRVLSGSMPTDWMRSETGLCGKAALPSEEWFDRACPELVEGLTMSGCGLTARGREPTISGTAVRWLGDGCYAPQTSRNSRIQLPPSTLAISASP